jgi:hypothetical protein
VFGVEKTIADRYVLRAEIGRGGMGRVWRAEDLVLRRTVAVKEVLLAASVPAERQADLCERLVREARIAAQLRHPALVKVHDVLTYDGRPWIVMELLEGRSLDDIIDIDGPLPVDEAARIFSPLLDALDVVHRAGVLHRDLKPANIIVDESGAPTLTDFGIAKADEDPALTVPGMLVGSPPYLPPERVTGKGKIGPASDLYSFGATLFAAVEGNPPYVRDTPLTTVAAIMTDPPDPVRRAGELAELFTGLLEKDPGKRWDSARTREFLRRVAAASATTRQIPLPAPKKSRRVWWIAAVAAAVAIVVVAAIVVIPQLFHGSPPPASAPTAAVTAFHHPGGFTVSVPAEWTKQGVRPVRFHRPDQQVWLQLYAERVPANVTQLDVWSAGHTRQLTGTDAERTVGYKLIGIRNATLHGRPGAEWEWTYLSKTSAPRHTLYRGTVVNGISYQLAISAPEAEFAAARRTFDQVSQTFVLG